MTSSDLDDVAKMEQEHFSMPWSRDDFKMCLLRPDEMGCVVAEADDKIVGCVVYRNIVGDVDITNVQVKEAYRRQGIAAALMKEAMKMARTIGGERFTLEVRESNLAAIALYESLGFVIEGRRRGFYSHPVEDALIMWA